MSALAGCPPYLLVFTASEEIHCIIGSFHKEQDEWLYTGHWTVYTGQWAVYTGQWTVYTGQNKSKNIFGMSLKYVICHNEMWNQRLNDAMYETFNIDR
jgi:hypothetical protein